VYDTTAFIVAHHLENKGAEVIDKRLLARRDDHNVFYVSKKVHIVLVQRPAGSSKLSRITGLS